MRHRAWILNINRLLFAILVISLNASAFGDTPPKSKPTKAKPVSGGSASPAQVTYKIDQDFCDTTTPYTYTDVSGKHGKPQNAQTPPPRVQYSVDPVYSSLTVKSSITKKLDFFVDPGTPIVTHSQTKLMSDGSDASRLLARAFAAGPCGNTTPIATNTQPFSLVSAQYWVINLVTWKRITDSKGSWYQVASNDWYVFNTSDHSVARQVPFQSFHPSLDNGARIYGSKAVGFLAIHLKSEDVNEKDFKALTISYDVKIEQKQPINVQDLMTLLGIIGNVAQAGSVTGQSSSTPPTAPTFIGLYGGGLVTGIEKLPDDITFTSNVSFAPSLIPLPTFSPPAGAYQATTVTISDSVPDTVIYYTVDGTTPTSNSTRYTGPIAVNATTTINAIATVAAGTTSLLATASYTISNNAPPAPPAPVPPPPVAPTFTPGQGTYSGGQKVALSDSTRGTSIYYTTDGTPPTSSSSQYFNPISVSATTTIKAIAVANGQSSPPASAVYTITASAGTTSSPSTSSSATCTQSADQQTRQQTSCSFSKKYDDEGLYYWDIGVGVPINALNQLNYSSTDGTVTAKMVSKENAYGFFDIYPVKTDVKSPPAFGYPHFVVGLPFSGQVFNKPFFGAGGVFNVKKLPAIGTALSKIVPLQLNFYGGLTYNKESRPKTLAVGSTASPAALANDLQGHRVWKVQYGIEFSIRDVKDKLTTSSKKKTTTGSTSTNTGGASSSKSGS
jgi:Chitobiase/beta-hexosaminidase C-terminal domain